MSITSPVFIGFVAVLLILYYAFPRRGQWFILLAGSLVFYLFTDIWLGWYILFTTASIYSGAMLIARQNAALESWQIDNRQADKESRKQRRRQNEKLIKLIQAIVIVANLGILAFLKYYNFIALNINGLIGAASMPTLELVLPLGISFYTFQSIGYLIDVGRGVAQPQRNPLKLGLFITYFPTVMQGPISRYDDLGSQLYEPHRFQYENVRDGMIRFAWGMFKKLVIADRLAGFVAAVYDNWASCTGPVLILGTIVFAFQLYTDFSGFMDMTIGVSHMLGIKLVENFDTPFFSRSIQEYWRRWHMTLGGWLRDYLFYPVLKSKPIQAISKNGAKPLGKKRAKALSRNAALFILWFFIGLWHGASWNFVIGTGLLHWAYIVLGEACMPLFDRTKKALHINGEAFWFRLFQQLRTFLLVCVGFVFFRSESVGVALRMLKVILKTFIRPKWLYPKGMLDGYPQGYCIMLVAFLLVLMIVSIIKQKHSPLELLARQHCAVRWVVYIALATAIILLGNWDSGDMSSQFIYYQF